MAPEYFRHLVPPTIQSTTIYPLRNGDNLIVPFCRLQFWQRLIEVFLICLNSQFHNYLRLHKRIQKGGECRLNTFFLNAARIVTGLPIFTKSEYLYAETGWETLSERRYRRKLQLFGINDELVIESLQKGTIKLSPFRKGYIVVL
jgi:hypothetical protein